MGPRTEEMREARRFGGRYEENSVGGELCVVAASCQMVVGGKRRVTSSSAESSELIPRHPQPHTSPHKLDSDSHSCTAHTTRHPIREPVLAAINDRVDQQRPLNRASSPSADLHLANQAEPCSPGSRARPADLPFRPSDANSIRPRCTRPGERSGASSISIWTSQRTSTGRTRSSSS